MCINFMRVIYELQLVDLEQGHIWKGDSDQGQIYNLLRGEGNPSVVFLKQGVCPQKLRIYKVFYFYIVLKSM